MSDDRALNRATIDDLLEEAADRAERRRLGVFILARLLLPGLMLMLLVGAALVFLPRARALVITAVALFLIFGTLTLLLERNRDLVGASRPVATAAAFVQAVFYTAYIIGAVFVYVLRSPVILSGVVAANLFGLLFWRFRRVYLDAADDGAQQGG